jgi:hypothetical protein
VVQFKAIWVVPLYGKPAASPPGITSPQYLLFGAYENVESNTAGFSDPAGRL